MVSLGLPQRTLSQPVQDLARRAAAPSLFFRLAQLLHPAPLRSLLGESEALCPLKRNRSGEQPQPCWPGDHAGETSETSGMKKLLSRRKTETQRKIDEALSNKNWGASSTLLNEIAQITYD